MRLTNTQYARAMDFLECLQTELYRKKSSIIGACYLCENEREQDLETVNNQIACVAIITQVVNDTELLR